MAVGARRYARLVALWAVVWLCRSALALAAPPLTSPDASPPSWTALRAALARRDFGLLERTLVAAQDAFERSVAHEDSLWAAYYGFAWPNPTFEPLLSEWVRSDPRSFSARAARAVHYDALGRASRGRAWASATSDAQISQMTEYLNMAAVDCLAALQARPRLLPCHILMLDVMKAGSAGPLAKRTYVTAALREDPGSYQIRRAYMHSLTPRWGGSHEEMAEFARSSQEHATSNPRLKLLLGYVAWDKGNMAVARGRPSESLPHFEEALRSGDDPLFLSDRGRAYYRLERWALAQADLAKALQLAPNGWSYGIVRLHEAFLYSGGALFMLRREAEAAPFFRRAAEVDDSDPEVRRWLDYLAQWRPSLPVPRAR